MNLPRKSDLLSAVQALQSTVGGAVIAEQPAVDRQSDEALRDSPVMQALDRMSRDYDLFWQQRPGSLALHRRMYDPQEPLGLEPEEIRGIAADLDRLVRPFIPPFDEIQNTRAQNAFFHALTLEQQAAMYRKEGLPFTALPRAQQDAWLPLNRASYFLSAGRQIGRANQVFRNWRGVGLAYQQIQDRGRWIVRFPSEKGVAGSEGEVLPHGDNDLWRSEKAPTGVGVALARRNEPSRASLERRVTIPAGPYTLQELVAALSALLQVKIDIPAYAAARKMLVAANDCSGSDVLAALEDLYGWELTAERSGHYRLHRPSGPPAHDVLDLWVKARRVLPPSVQLFWDAHMKEPRHEGACSALAMNRLAPALTQWVKTGRTQGQVGDLPAEDGRTLANLVLDRLLGAQSRAFIQAEPRWNLAAPEHGWFTLERGDTPDALPVLMFHVRTPAGSDDSWGWVVGSSSLEEVK